MSSRGRGRGGGRGGGRASAPAVKSSLADDWQNSLGGKKKAHAFAKFLASIEEEALSEDKDVSLLATIRSALFNFHNGLDVDGVKPTASNSTAKPPDTVGWVRVKDQPAEVVKRLISSVQSKLILVCPVCFCFFPPSLSSY